jgi:hypothetical protein
MSFGKDNSPKAYHLPHRVDYKRSTAFIPEAWNRINRFLTAAKAKPGVPVPPDVQPALVLPPECPTGEM